MEDRCREQGPELLEGFWGQVGASLLTAAFSHECGSPVFIPKAKETPGLCGGGCAVQIPTPQRCVQRAAGLPCSKWLLFLYGWPRGLVYVLCPFGSPCTHAPLCAQCLCLRSCQVPPFSCQPLPGDVGCRTGDLSLAGNRRRADTAPHLSNKRILSHRWVTLFMGLGAGGCAILGEDCWVRLGAEWVGAGSWARCPSGGRISHRT